MLSSRLIHLIESHWEQITTRVLRKIQSDQRLAQVGKLPPSELRERAENILRNLGKWLAASHGEELAARYEQLGRVRFRESIPLQEVVLAHIVIKNEMIDFTREQGLTRTPLDLYAEEELEHSVGHFFDSAVYHIVRGYEGAMRDAMNPSSAGRGKQAVSRGGD
jgi:hypothetical protein